MASFWVILFDPQQLWGEPPKLYNPRGLAPANIKHGCSIDQGLSNEANDTKHVKHKHTKKETSLSCPGRTSAGLTDESQWVHLRQPTAEKTTMPICLIQRAETHRGKERIGGGCDGWKAGDMQQDWSYLRVVWRDGGMRTNLEGRVVWRRVKQKHIVPKPHQRYNATVITCITKVITVRLD